MDLASSWRSWQLSEFIQFWSALFFLLCDDKIPFPSHELLMRNYQQGSNQIKIVKNQLFILDLAWFSSKNQVSFPFLLRVCTESIIDCGMKKPHCNLMIASFSSSLSLYVNIRIDLVGLTISIITTAKFIILFCFHFIIANILTMMVIIIFWMNPACTAAFWWWQGKEGYYQKHLSDIFSSQCWWCWS